MSPAALAGFTISLLYFHQFCAWTHFDLFTSFRAPCTLEDSKLVPETPTLLLKFTACPAATAVSYKCVVFGTFSAASGIA